MGQGSTPLCARCKGPTAFRMLIAALEDQPELQIFQCTSCTRLDCWQQGRDEWKLHARPRLADRE